MNDWFENDSWSVLCWGIKHSTLQQALMLVLQRHNANIGAIKSFTAYIMIGMQRSTTISRALQSQGDDDTW